MKLDTEWSDPKERLNSLMAYLNEVGDIAAKKKAPLKPKRLQSLMDELKKNSQLGPHRELKQITFNEIHSWLREKGAECSKKVGSSNIMVESHPC